MTFLPLLPPLPGTPKKKIGRPSDYSVKLAGEICARMAEGESLRSVCRDVNMPSKTAVLHWLEKHDEFRAQYARAMNERADHWADEIVTISDDGLNDTYLDDQGNPRTDNDVIARSRLRVDTRKWLMARMAPKKYGDKITTEHQGPDGGPVVFQTVYETKPPESAQ